MRWDRISILRDRLRPELTAFGLVYKSNNSISLDFLHHL